MLPINVYPYNKTVKKIRRSIESTEQYLNKFWHRPAIILSSARVGLYEIINFFGLTRQDHLLVPNFTCQSILNILNKNCFPVQIHDSKTKAVLVLHQWGYPQKMDEVVTEAKKKNLIIIEDCAHSLDSLYQGKVIGSFGDAAIFSLSKLLPVYLGGTVISDNKKLLDYLKEIKTKKQNWKNHLFNFIAFTVMKKNFHEKKWSNLLDMLYLTSVNYPHIKKNALFLLPANINEFKAIQNRRQKNYQYLIHNIPDRFLIPDHDPDIKPNPIYLPVFLDPEKFSAAKQNLLSQNIETEILHFDINRNIFHSNYQKCLAIPTHQNLPSSALEIIVKTINQI